MSLMTSDPTQRHDPDHVVAPNTLQDAIRARALYAIERDRSVRKRSPRQIVIAVLLMLLCVGTFLFVIDLSVRTMHRIMTLWFPTHTQVQPDVSQPYPVIVEPGATTQIPPTAVSSAQSATSNSSR